MPFLRSQKVLIFVVVVLLLIAGVVIGTLQAQRPDVPTVQEDPAAAQGAATVLMIRDIMRAQMDSFGGWLPNDTPFSPSFYLDNMPSFQLGVLQVVRHASRVLRDNLTRQRTSDAVHKDTDLAYSAFANDPHKWAFPSAESAFGRGVNAMTRFSEQLRQNPTFYPRSDNLIQLLEPLVSELGAITTRLLQSQDEGAVSWWKIDDNFYMAQGVGYATLGVMLAVQHDFADVLRDKNAQEITDLILKSLQGSQFDPIIVTNGGKAGILANHSNNVKVYLDDARQKMNSLIAILRQG